MPPINPKAVLTIPTFVPWSISMVPMRRCRLAPRTPPVLGEEDPGKVLLSISLPETNGYDVELIIVMGMRQPLCLRASV